MILVPVIDLAAGQVVHARGGERSGYPPLRSILCASSRPVDVVEGLLSLYPFPRLYIADLDAIGRHGHQRETIALLHRTFPALQLWVDAGAATRGDWLHMRDTSPALPVLGTETLEAGGLPPPGEGEYILSLDFRDDIPLGGSGLPDNPRLWPDRLICMCLDRVGSRRGPDLQTLRRIARLAPHAELYAAGGIRSAADLETLREHHITGALLATALHDGSIGAADLERFS